MASSATSNNPNSSSRHTTENRGSPTAAQSRHVSSSPWTQIVRGESDPPTIAAPSSHQTKPRIDPIAAASSSSSTEVGPVMGASSWPALSETTNNNNKSSSDSLKSLGVGSDVAPSPPPVPVSQV